MNKLITRNNTFAFIAILISSSITIIPFIPSMAFFYNGTSDIPTLAGKLTSIIGALFTLLILYLHLTNGVTESKLDSRLSNLDQFIHKLPEIKYIDSNQFYLDFLLGVKQAKHLVCIAYLAPFPPTAPNKPERKKYYKDLEQFISKSNGTITFKRLIRFSEENKQWIKELVEKFKDTPGFELAVIRDIGPDTEIMPSALSVQVIDNYSSWLVAIEDHEQKGTPRDIFIRSEVFAAGMRAYYERLWKKSTVLLDASRRLTHDGKRFLETGKI